MCAIACGCLCGRRYRVFIEPVRSVNVVVIGPPGVGKSSIVARLQARARQLRRCESGSGSGSDSGRRRRHPPSSSTAGVDVRHAIDMDIGIQWTFKEVGIALQPLWRSFLRAADTVLVVLEAAAVASTAHDNSVLESISMFAKDKLVFYLFNKRDQHPEVTKDTLIERVLHSPPKVGGHPRRYPDVHFVTAVEADDDIAGVTALYKALLFVADWIPSRGTA